MTTTFRSTHQFEETLAGPTGELEWTPTSREQSYLDSLPEGSIAVYQEALGLIFSTVALIATAGIHDQDLSRRLGIIAETIAIEALPLLPPGLTLILPGEINWRPASGSGVNVQTSRALLDIALICTAGLRHNDLLIRLTREIQVQEVAVDAAFSLHIVFG